MTPVKPPPIRLSREIRQQIERIEEDATGSIAARHKHQRQKKWMAQH